MAGCGAIVQIAGNMPSNYFIKIKIENNSIYIMYYIIII